jgi:small-conductance mechanosensitive channel/CRP-like cAMP-binding protein
MTIFARMVTSAGLLIGLLLLRRLLQQKQLPPPPWRLPAAALLLQVVGDPLASLLPGAGRSLMLLLDGLMSSYALVVLVSWALLQLPAALGMGRPIPQILRDLLALAVAALLTVLNLRQGGVNLVGLVTTSAVLTAVIGLAAQETLKDLFGGLSMQIGSAFRVGDWVDLGTQRGWVESITLMNTVLIGLEGAEIVVPNSQAAAAAARRYRPGQPVGHRFALGLDYNHPPAQALRLLQDALQRHPDVLADPPPQAWISRFGESSVEYELLLFQREAGDGPQLRLRGELLQQIWYALQREGRSIPFPVLELRRPLARESLADEPNWSRSEQRAERLKANPLFAGLSDQELATLAPLTRCLRFGPGETVVREGERGDCLYQVLSGAVEVRKEQPPGGDGASELKVAQLGADAVFGEMTLFTDAPRNATVRALEDTVLLEVERRDLVPLLKSNPTLLEQLGALVSARQQELERLSDAGASERTGGLVETMRKLFAGLGVR